MSTADLAFIRAMQEEALPDAVTIQTVTNVADGEGGETPTWADTYEDVPCRLVYLTANVGIGKVSGMAAILLSAGQINPNRAYVLTVKADQPLDPTMQVVDSAGRVYSVINTNLGASWSQVKRALVVLQEQTT